MEEDWTTKTRSLLGADFKTRSREAVAPRQSLVFTLTAEHSVFVLLRRNVLLPLPLAVTVLATQPAVEAILKTGMIRTHV